MSKFRVGDVCEVVNLALNQDLNGEQCVVISDLKFIRAKLTNGDYIEAYAHQVDGGFVAEQLRKTGTSKYWLRPQFLRLRRPPYWDKWLYETREVKDEQPVIS